MKNYQFHYIQFGSVSKIDYNNNIMTKIHNNINCYNSNIFIDTTIRCFMNESATGFSARRMIVI